jgi:hypothetical protein
MLRRRDIFTTVNIIFFLQLQISETLNIPPWLHVISLVIVSSVLVEIVFFILKNV